MSAKFLCYTLPTSIHVLHVIIIRIYVADMRLRSWKRPAVLGYDEVDDASLLQSTAYMTLDVKYKQTDKNKEVIPHSLEFWVYFSEPYDEYFSWKHALLCSPDCEGNFR